MIYKKKKKKTIVLFENVLNSTILGLTYSNSEAVTFKNNSRVYKEKLFPFNLDLNDNLTPELTVKVFNVTPLTSKCRDLGHSRHSTELLPCAWVIVG